MRNGSIYRNGCNKVINGSTENGAPIFPVETLREGLGIDISIASLPGATAKMGRINWSG